MEHHVTPEEAGMRLRDVLRQIMGVSYGAMKSAKWEGRILVNGQPRTVDQPVAAGELVTLVDAPCCPCLPAKALLPPRGYSLGGRASSHRG